MRLLIFLLFTFYLLLLLAEDQNARRNRSSLSHVVYVNGTRAKSSVSRLIAAGLCAGGYRVFCKTTGTDPIVIHCDGREELLTRRGRANIKEQLRILRQAAAEQADILVIECMAVDPRLQWVSQHRMLQADLGVITNARLDHTDQMGDTPEDICRSLCSTIPQNGVVFTADQAHAAIIRSEAARLGSAFILARPDQSLPGEIDFSENLALALAVCEHLHISRETALSGMAHYRRDPYALSAHRLSNDTLFLNGFSVNDPQSTRKVWLHCKKKLALENRRFILLINNRPDRGCRSEHMILLANWLSPDEIWITGAFSGVMRRRLRADFKDRIPVSAFGRPEALPISRQVHTVIFAVGNLACGGRRVLQLVREEESHVS